MTTAEYELILSHDPCHVFQYYGVDSIHGLTLQACKGYNNTPDDSYICGLCNYVPKAEGNYKHGDRMFVFINLTRCGNDLDLITTLYHELMHYSFAHYNWDISQEERMITMAEQECKKVYKLIKSNYDN